MESALLLDVVVRESAPIFQLLSSEDQALLVWWDALLILDLALDIVNRIGAFDFEGDCLSGQGLNKDLHTTTEAEHEMEGGFFLDVVVG